MGTNYSSLFSTNKKIQKCSPQVSLHNMPDVVLDKIMKNLDFRSIRNLRKVCHDLQNYIDDVKPDAKLTDVAIYVKTDSIMINYGYSNDKFEIDYRKYEDGCLVILNKKHQKILDDVDFMNAFLKDFDLILKFQKSNLRVFGFYQRDSNPYDNPIIPPLLKALKKILEFRSHSLKTEKFEMLPTEQSQILCFLPYFDTRILKEIKFLEANHRDVEILEIDEIVKFDQWTNAKKITIKKHIDSSFFPHFGSFSTVLLKTVSITMRDLQVLKETFSNSSTLNKFLFNYEKFDDEEQFWTVYYDRNYFRIPKNNNQVLSILYDQDNNFFEFCRVELSDVPQNSVIKN